MPSRPKPDATHRIEQSGGSTPSRTEVIEPSCVTAVLARARESGLTEGKGGRISGRVSPALIARAKARTGLKSDTALIEFALANVAIEDGFMQVFRALRGTIGPELDLNF